MPAPPHRRVFRTIASAGPAIFTAFVAFAGFALSACGDPLPDPLLDDLRAIPGLTVEERASPVGGYRCFAMTFEQPASHDRPLGSGGPRFAQRLWLLHRHTAAPTVITTSGYHLSRVALAELPVRLAGNQLNVEHRFFEPSRPAPADWHDLTIRQAAEDHHRIITAFRRIYPGRWLSSGGSKGGMASVFHRRFHPGDVDGTLAYVAPLVKEALDDSYGAFIEKVGRTASLANPTCGARLVALQRRLLAARDEIEPMVPGREPGVQYSFMGVAKAYEHTVLELPWYFWQYQRATLCASIPGDGATAAEMLEFLEKVHKISEYGDASLAAFRPYYHQSATETGYGALPEDDLADLLQYPGTAVPATYLTPELLPVRFDPAVMADIDQWVRTEARSILFVYGENDPWSATPFDLGADPAARELYKLVVRGGNHQSRFSQLPPIDLPIAEAALARWAGLSSLVPVPPAPRALTAEGREESPWPARERPGTGPNSDR